MCKKGEQEDSSGHERPPIGGRGSFDGWKVLLITSSSVDVNRLFSCSNTRPLTVQRTFGEWAGPMERGGESSRGFMFPIAGSRFANSQTTPTPPLRRWSETGGVAHNSQVLTICFVITVRRETLMGPGNAVDISRIATHAQTASQYSLGRLGEGLVLISPHLVGRTL